MSKPNWQMREIIQYTYVKISTIFNGPPFTNIMTFKNKKLINSNQKKKKKSLSLHPTKRRRRKKKGSFHLTIPSDFITGTILPFHQIGRESQKIKVEYMNDIMSYFRTIIITAPFFTFT